MEDPYVGACYRPNVWDSDTLDKHHLLAGNFNFPGFDRGISIRPGSTYANLHQRFLNMISNFVLQQVITEPTCSGSTMDLILTNKSTLA